MKEVTLTQVNREIHYYGYYGCWQSEVVETYRVRKDLAAKLAILADGGEVNGDTSYGVHNVRQDGRYWYADWSLEIVEGDEAQGDPESWLFEELMAGHIALDISTIIGRNVDCDAINWRGEGR